MMILRDLDFDDAQPMLNWLCDKQVNRWLDGDMNSLTLQDMENYIAAALLLEGSAQKAVSDERGRFLGLVSLKNINQRCHSAELSLGLAPEVWGKGWATAAARELLDYGFRCLDLQYVYGCVNKNNQAALNFCARYGMEELQQPPQEAAGDTKADHLRWFALRRRDK